MHSLSKILSTRFSSSESYKVGRSFKQMFAFLLYIRFPGCTLARNRLSVLTAIKPSQTRYYSFYYSNYSLQSLKYISLFSAIVQNNMSIHIKIHTGEKNECSTCNKVFRTMTKLREHEKSHEISPEQELVDESTSDCNEK